MGVALLATAWRLLGDPRYRELYDYDLVKAWTIETPAGWSSLDGFLADLGRSLDALHRLRTHPIGQSLRHGSQTNQNLLLADDAAIRAFFRAVDDPIRAYLATTGQGDAYAIAGAWSVKLRSGGYHACHVHPAGWLSSAFYVSLPKTLGGGERRDGWLKFGEPGAPTRPALGPEHFVRPEPGRLVLFPSYMWHGTVPFVGEAARLTVAFDVTLPRGDRV
jgi:hypothetical protein